MEKGSDRKENTPDLKSFYRSLILEWFLETVFFDVWWGIENGLEK